MNRTQPLKKRDVVVDDKGNHFVVIAEPDSDGTVRLQSVVTKDSFRAPVTDLTHCPGLVAA